MIKYKMGPAFVNKFLEETEMRKYIKRFFKENKGGSEITQSLLLIGVAISLVLTIFFPGLKKVFGGVSDDMNTWLKNSAKQVFEVDIPENEG